MVIPSLYRVEEVANKAGCSLYGEEFIEQLNNVPRRKFAHRVRVIPQKKAVLEMKAELTKDNNVVEIQQTENKQLSLLERIVTLEKKVVELSQLLGI